MLARMRITKEKNRAAIEFYCRVLMLVKKARK